MKNYFLILCLYCCIASLSAQIPLEGKELEQYKNLVEPAMEAYENKDYQKCIDCYEKAFKISKHSVYSMSTAAKCHSLNGNHKQAAHWIAAAGKVDIEQMTDWLADEAYNNVRKKKCTWKKLNKQLEKDRLAYEATINVPLRDELRAMKKTDQEHRKKMRAVSEKYGKDAPEMKALWVKQNKVDAYNIKRLEAIIEEYGYPGKKLVGKSTANAAFLIIQHADLEYQEKYLPLLEKAAAAGELNKSSLALLIDRILLRNDKPQRYGSQVAQDEETGLYFFSEMEDPKNVDVRRKEMGLGPLAEYGALWDIQWPPKTTASIKDKALIGKWKLKAIKYFPQDEIVMAKKDYWISFEKIKVQYNLETNKCFTKYELLGDNKIKFNPDAPCTKMCCDKDISDKLKYLNAHTYKIKDNKLTLTTDKERFEFVKDAGK